MAKLHAVVAGIDFDATVDDITRKTLEDDYHDKLASGIKADYDAWSK